MAGRELNKKEVPHGTSFFVQKFSSIDRNFAVNCEKSGAVFALNARRNVFSDFFLNKYMILRIVEKVCSLITDNSRTDQKGKSNHKIHQVSAAIIRHRSIPFINFKWQNQNRCRNLDATKEKIQNQTSSPSRTIE